MPSFKSTSVALLLSFAGAARGDMSLMAQKAADPNVGALTGAAVPAVQPTAACPPTVSTQTLEQEGPDSLLHDNLLTGTPSIHPSARLLVLLHAASWPTHDAIPFIPPSLACCLSFPLYPHACSLSDVSEKSVLMMLFLPLLTLPSSFMV